MNGLELYLSKRVFKPGETIYGAVFLKVLKPAEFDAISVQLECRLIFKSFNINTEKDLSQAPLEIFRFPSHVNIGFYAFPFHLTLPKESLSSTSLSSSTKLVGPFVLKLDYNVSAFTSICSCRLIQTRSNFFVFLTPPVSNLEYINDSVLLDSNGVTLKLSISLKSVDPLSVFVSATSANPENVLAECKNSEDNSNGFSVNVSLERNHYELGDSVTIVSASRATKDINIDSICFRLIQCIELTPDLFKLSSSNLSNFSCEKLRFSEVLFGSLLPAITNRTSEFKIDLVQLPLPAFSPETFTPTVDCIFFHCHYEIEVSINLSSDHHNQNTVNQKPTSSYSPITLLLPIAIIPPKHFSSTSAGKYRSLDSSWLPLCLVALTDDEILDDRRFSSGKNIISVFRKSGLFSKPCQTITFSGAKRGPAGLSPQSVQNLKEFSRIPVFRHLGATSL